MRARRAAARAGVALAGVALASGCSFAPAPEPQPLVQELPDRFEQAQATPAGDTVRYDPTRWWLSFNDPALEALVDTALAANLDLREAVGRVEEVRNRYRIARSGFYPQISVGADVAFSSTPANTGLGGQFGGGDGEGAPASPFAGVDRFEFTTYSASLGLSYELDFWGRVSNDTKAAISDFFATRADYETARLGMIATTISTYLEVVELRRQVELTRLQVDLLRERSELTDERYLRGLVTSFELYTIRALYQSVQAGLPGLESRSFEAEGRLAILLGRYAGQLDELIGAASGPVLDLEPVPVELPASLLEQRPDVVAATQRVEAARYRIGARRAELLPAISINATAGLQGGEVGNLFRIDQHFLNLVGNLFAPLITGGRLRANVGVAEAQYEQQLAAYLRTVLTAFKEVETSLLSLEKEKERYAFLEEQRESAEASVDFQLRSFQRGVGSYLEYLDARRNLVTVETGLANAERSLADARLAIHRALGGAWAPVELREDRDTPEMAEMIP